MIKEIVDIGRVSNRLASVFTFKDLSKFYVEIILEKNGKDFKFIPNETIQNLTNIEQFLNYGVHRGKSGRVLYFFPTSFIVTKKELKNEKAKLIQKLKVGKKDISNFLEKEKEKKVFLETISDKLIDNINAILELAENGFDRAKQEGEEVENIAIVVKIKDNEKVYYVHEKENIFEIFQDIEFQNTSNEFTQGTGKKKKQIRGICNITQKEDLLYYPKGGFYYPFSTDKVNVKYNLKDDKNLFVLSKHAYIDFMIGKTFLENYHKFYFMHINSYITATSLNDAVLKEFQEDIKKSESNIDGLIKLISDNSSNRYELLLNFYFFEPTKTGNNIIEYIKDVIPSVLVDNIELFKDVKDYYEIEFLKNQPNRDLNKFNWQWHIYNIFSKDSYKRFRTSLFREIALNDKINLEHILLFINQKMQYGINKDDKDKNRYVHGDVLKNFIFLNWLNKINKGEQEMSEEEKIELFIGESYEEKLTYFLQNANLVKKSSSMKIGICIGLAIDILSWSINGYDKKTLAFVGKRVERNSLNSVEIFINEIFAKTKFHEYSGLQSINIKLATLEMLNLNDKSFNKDEFIFGLFLGNELYPNVESEKNRQKSINNQEEIESNEGESNE